MLIIGASNSARFLRSSLRASKRENQYCSDWQAPCRPNNLVGCSWIELESLACYITSPLWSVYNDDETACAGDHSAVSSWQPCLKSTAAVKKSVICVPVILPH
ncbi:hypothetical protein RRG08_037209 [Elysia crispata]|uniref:Uncharacterized protein n=1 Tax=Elysia crispata TaxID=231223 RepID=A0AAE0Z3V1_9GAST|nr:hypothetical protein RRG08_037209 [Elysia crispata]